MNKHSHHLEPLSLPLCGSQLIEASAGTGKTFTIALLYVRLILGHGKLPDNWASGLVPPNLLVVTFTEAATKELRDRIRSRLTEAAAVFAAAPDCPVPPGEAVLFALRDQYEPARWPECQRKLLLAAEWMDEAAVSTIHSWCKRMLSEHAFDSGSLFRLALETDQSELRDQVLRDYWRTFAYPLSGAEATVFTGFWKNPQQLGSALWPLLAHVEHLDPALEEPRSLLAELTGEVSQLKARWQAVAEALALAMDEAISQKAFDGRKLRRDWWENWFAACQQWAADPEALLPILSEAAWNRLCPSGIAEVIKQDHPIGEHGAWALLENVCAVQQRTAACRSRIVCHGAHWVAERFEAEKQRRSEMGFNDLLSRLDRALHGPQGEKLAATIRGQFPVALIDEFQDTDPIQYRIFDRVYRLADNDESTCLLMIGDPKQAIYAFRGADIFTYLSARQAAAERTYTLATNYRSAEPMVASVNLLFDRAHQARVQGAFLFGRDGDSPLPFQPVAAKGIERRWTVNGKSAPALSVWVQNGKPNGKGKFTWVTKGDFHQIMAEASASEIVRLLNLGREGRAGFEDSTGELQALQPADIAVLVNNRQEANAVRQALARRRVRSVYLSDRDSVLQAGEAREILAWLRACSEPTQLSLLRSALATPTLAQSWRQLQDLLADEMVLEGMVERFMGYQALWQRQGVLPMLRRLLLDFQVPARLLERPDGERRLTDILHIAELLQQDSQHLDGEHALIRHYIQLLREGKDEDEYRSIRLESDAGLVKVITIHKSKGLEYPLVFLPFATHFRSLEGRSVESKQYVSYHDDNKQLQVVLDPSPDDVAKADRERLGEDIRKLYVGLTRARYATWVGAAAIKDWNCSGLGQLIHGGNAEQALEEQLANLLGEHPAISVMPVPEGSDEKHIEEAATELGSPMESKRAAPESWWIASYSALTYQGVAYDGADIESPREQNMLEDTAETTRPDGPPPMDQHGFHKGAGPGTFLHDCLEYCAHLGFAAVLADPLPLRQWLSVRCSTRGWEKWVPVLEQWIIRILSRPIPLTSESPGQCPSVSLSELCQYRPELEFWFASCHTSSAALDRLVCRHTLDAAPRPRLEPQVLNGMLKGFVDLVFEHQGRYYVLDYKSNALGSSDAAYGRAAMAKAMCDKRYDLQYTLYLLALHRLLKARLPDYDYDRHVGGAIYLFLRGCEADSAGAFVERPARQLLEALDALFDGDDALAVEGLDGEQLCGEARVSEELGEELAAKDLNPQEEVSP